MENKDKCCSSSIEKPWPLCCDGKTCWENWRLFLLARAAEKKPAHEAPEAAY